MSTTDILIPSASTGAKTKVLLNMTNYYIFTSIFELILVLYAFLVLFMAKPVQFAGNSKGFTYATMSNRHHPRKSPHLNR